MKKLMAIIALFCMAVGGGILLPTLGSAAELAIEVAYIKPVKYKLRLSSGLPPGSPYDLGAHRFAELVNEYSRGEIEVKIFPSAQLGTEQVAIKMVQLGTLDLSLQAVNNSTMWYRPMDIYNIYRLFLYQLSLSR